MYKSCKINVKVKENRCKIDVLACAGVVLGCKFEVFQLMYYIVVKVAMW